MDTLIFYFKTYPTVRYSTLVLALVSLCAALLGVSLVLKRYSMIGDGLSHVGFGAAVIATALGFAPLAVAIPVVVIFAFLLLRLGENSKIKGDAAVAIVSTGALAAGVAVSSLSGGMNQDFNSYMFGTILGLSDSDVILSIAVSVPVLILFILFYNKIFAVTFDEGFATSSGVRVRAYNFLIAAVSGVVIVLAMKLVGALLISSLIIFPALSAMRVFRSFLSVVLCSAVISVAGSLTGLLLALLLSTPTGASVAVVHIGIFIVFTLVGKIRHS